MISNVSTQLPLPSPPKARENSPAHGGLSSPEQKATEQVREVSKEEQVRKLSKEEQGQVKKLSKEEQGLAGELSKEEQGLVEKLKKSDQEVKAHEAAHKNAGGQYAGSASFSYTVGPDGKKYAVAGEVSIDVSPIKDNPEATLAKLDVIIAAALAPAKPSSQDRKVAAAAVAARNTARAELFEQKRAEQADANTEPFDVNDFGDTPVESANKAYASGNDFSQNNSTTGNNFNVSS